jgi:hypothetical protein
VFDYRVAASTEYFYFTSGVFPFSRKLERLMLELEFSGDLGAELGKTFPFCDHKVRG